MIEEGYDLKCKVPKFFSATRFANYAKEVYIRFRCCYIISLETILYICIFLKTLILVYNFCCPGRATLYWWPA